MRWFKHLAASANDEKIARLMAAAGLEGYGFWWRIVEIVAEKIGDKPGENDETSVTFPAKKWGSLLELRPDKFRKLAKLCQNCGLFQVNFSENSITINMPNILKFRDEWTRKKTRNSRVAPEERRSLARAFLPDPDTDTEDINTPPSPPAGGASCEGEEPPASALEEMDLGFQQFLDAYPADHRQPVGEAAQVWKKLAKERALPGLPALLAGLQDWMDSARWQKDGGAYVPKAANFLRRAMWRDKPPTAPPRASPALPPLSVRDAEILERDQRARRLLARRAEERKHA